MKRFMKVVSSLLIVIMCFSSVAYAATTQYSLVSFWGGTYGLKGDFKLPTLVSAWDNGTNRFNKINFEFWLPVNGSTGDWLEVGYKHGNTADGTTNAAFYNGFFKSKQVNGVYGYGSLNKAFSLGSKYTFTIVDVNKQGLWEIYIGQTYFGRFADTVGLASSTSHNDYGYEVTRQSGTQSTTSTTITNMNYYDGSWKSISNKSPFTTNNSSIVTSSYNSNTNTATFTKK